jgi:hippurate hydrolase
MMDRFGIDEVYGMHNWPGLPVGDFQIRPGAFFAATDVFEVVIKGTGGHAAKPHETVDPTIAAAQIVLALQSIVSRNADPNSKAVVSVTSFETSSTAFNVIPERVHLKGTVRTLDPATHDLCETRFSEIVANMSAAFGCQAEIDYLRNYPVMVNSEAETLHAEEAAKRVSGKCGLAEQTMGGEDFAFMLNARPGAYILVGNGDTAKVHSPDYNFSDEVIPFGCSWLVEIAESRLSAS